jgi:hypothetical protein
MLKIPKGRSVPPPAIVIVPHTDRSHPADPANPASQTVRSRRILSDPKMGIDEDKLSASAIAHFLHFARSPSNAPRTDTTDTLPSTHPICPVTVQLTSESTRGSNSRESVRLYCQETRKSLIEMSHSQSGGFPDASCLAKSWDIALPLRMKVWCLGRRAAMSEVAEHDENDLEAFRICTTRRDVKSLSPVPALL